MFARLLLVFILVPLADLILLLMISKFTNVAFTIALIVVSGIIGAWFARQQGTKVTEKIRNEFQQNMMPSSLLTDGAMILFAAGLLITPGMLTGAFGFSLLVPACRVWYKKKTLAFMKDHFKVQVKKSFGEVNPYESPDVVDGEVVDRPHAQKPVAPSKLDSPDSTIIDL